MASARRGGTGFVQHYQHQPSCKIVEWDTSPNVYPQQLVTQHTPLYPIGPSNSWRGITISAPH